MLEDATINQQMMDLLSEGVYFVDTERRITSWNKAAENITGYRRGAILQHHCYDNILKHVDSDGRRLCFAGCPLQATMKDGCSREADVYLSHRDGHRVSVHVRTAPVYDEANNIVGGMEVFTENQYQLSSLERIEDLRKAAFLDALTGLPNRRYGEMALRSRLNFLGLEALPFAICLVDVDRFKIINDIHGHGAGDQALRTLGETLKNSVRTYDTVIRWGGDEFVVLLLNIDGRRLAKYAGRMLALVGQSEIRPKGAAVHLSISIGAVIARAEDSLETLLERADRLMYTSKGLGGGHATLEGGPEPLFG
jgi:diguanylate cyclase (GGDEF)-like protein/PAS domain S-box-containing protein